MGTDLPKQLHCLVATIAAVAALSGCSSNVAAVQPNDELVTAPWTGPRHRNGHDLNLLGDKIQSGMTESAVAAAIGRPTRIVQMRRNHYWFYSTADGDLRLFFDPEGIVQHADKEPITIRYKSPQTRTTSEMKQRVRVGMDRRTLFDAVGAPDGMRIASSNNPLFAADPSGHYWSLSYDCRDGRLLLLMDDNSRILLVKEASKQARR